jgi:hypothetical protein
MLFPKCFGSLPVVMLLALMGHPLLAQTNPLQKNMLTTSGVRFTVTDRVWPSSVGAASVCLWADDKLAAVSIGVDDNTQPDHAWWVSMGKKYGFRFTWWVISGWVDDGGGSFFGSWADFRALFAEGHELGSHSVQHENIDAGNDAYWDNEMRLSNAAIEAGVPGCTVKTFAGPYGKVPSSATTAKYYISARGTGGNTNRANQINYGETTVWDDFSVACHLTPGVNSWPCSYRGWMVSFHHYLKGENNALENNLLKPVYDQRDNVWMGRYGDVAAYGQSRDTHTLTVTGVSNSLITFSLTDSMNDTRFNYPLTVKVRVNNSWNSCDAWQNGNPVEVTMVTNAGNQYALVKAVPDRGVVSLTKSGTTGLKKTRAAQFPAPNNGNPAALFDLCGRRLGTAQINAQGLVSTDITGGLPAGVYLFKIESTDRFEKRLIVVHK